MLRNLLKHSAVYTAADCVLKSFPQLYDAHREQKTEPGITQQKHTDGRAGLDASWKAKTNSGLDRENISIQDLYCSAVGIDLNYCT